MMHSHTRAIGPLFLFVPALAFAQGHAKAQACFFSADFEDGNVPSGWDIGPLVERQTSEGASLGEFVPAWTVGTAAQANANGAFPVADIPTGNHFVMANDDAAPCNCTMADVALTTPPIDLTGRTNVWLEGRFFNTELAGGDTATIEVSTDGVLWDTVFVMPPWNDWIPIVADLSAYDGEPVLQIRFHWSDGGTWAGGFAVDDICLRERLQNDLSVISVNTGGSGDPFEGGDQSLRYRLLPLSQAGPLTPVVRLMNRGLSTATAVNIAVTITLDGSEVYNSPSNAVGDILPGGPAIGYSIGTDWTPTGLGEVIVNITVTSAQDDDPTDNTGTATMRITGPGWENGYSAMACDEGVAQGAVGGSDGFIAANRMEILNDGSTAQGVSAVIAGNSQEGELVRSILMDANFAFIDTSLRHTLTAEDLTNGWLGEPIYLPFSATPALAPGDYHVGLQRLAGTGDVFVSTSGNSPVGAAVLMEGTTFDITYLTGTPMVRLHLESYGVGLSEQHDGSRTMRVYPVPASDMITLEFDLINATRVLIEVVDLMGRTVLRQAGGWMSPGQQVRQAAVGDLAPGSYTVRVVTDAGGLEQPLIIAR
ncbi:MAG: T9SS type A sorting domain-containing protein [Flavobacteriales bacterium]